MKKIVSIIALAVLMQTTQGAQLPFVEGTFGDFMDRIVAMEHQDELQRKYYKTYKRYRNQKDPKWEKKYERKYDDLKKQGRMHLEVTNPLWANQIRTTLEKGCHPTQRQKIDDFLFCCGVYADFLQKEGERHHTLWAKTKAYFRNTSNSVVSWFGSWRKSKSEDMSAEALA